MNTDLPIEQHFPVGLVAKRCGFASLAHFKALLRAKGIKLTKFSDRGLRISESELRRFLASCAPSEESK